MVLQELLTHELLLKWESAPVVRLQQPRVVDGTVQGMEEFATDATTLSARWLKPRSDVQFVKVIGALLQE